MEQGGITDMQVHVPECEDAAVDDVEVPLDQSLNCPDNLIYASEASSSPQTSPNLSWMNKLSDSFLAAGLFEDETMREEVDVGKLPTKIEKNLKQTSSTAEIFPVVNANTPKAACSANLTGSTSNIDLVSKTKLGRQSFGKHPREKEIEDSDDFSGEQ